MNEMNSALNRAGRKPVFTEQSALEFLEARKMWGATQTAREWVAFAVNEGFISRACSEATMRRLLAGKLFPHLKEPGPDGSPTAKPYDYSVVPLAKRGHPTNAETADYDTGAPKRKLSKLRQQVIDEAMEAARVHALTQLKIATQDDFITFRTEIAALKRRVLELEMKAGIKDNIPDAPQAPKAPEPEDSTNYCMPKATGQFDSHLPARSHAVGLTPE